MNEQPSLADALRTAELVHDRATIEAAITRIADELRRDYADKRPCVMTIMNGGMYFSSLLGLQLGFDIEFDYLHATRYRGETSGGAVLNWLHRPYRPIEGKTLLLADDILDEGPTLDEVRRWCLEQGAAEVKLVVMAWKRHGRGVPGLVPDYWGLEVPDRYVFGFGMDYHEQGRNLPAIYALA